MEKLTEKRCYRCGKIKPITDFNKNKKFDAIYYNNWKSGAEDLLKIF